MFHPAVWIDIISKAKRIVELTLTYSPKKCQGIPVCTLKLECWRQTPRITRMDKIRNEVIRGGMIWQSP